ncbi:MAG TPA: SGNH/GDSL hydrolase family protein [Candidatus Nitrosotalea sp.]|nr:SGNH/GDSL hydrolase family protein [Candidatus Nitrosotalea sp.]
MNRFLIAFLFVALAGSAFSEDQIEARPADPYFVRFNPVKAPRPRALVLKKGDRLAICGDSITEQKMYSRIMETYLTVCVPELEITVRQYGWSGERAPGFLARMTNDCLRFNPTVATTCYGMNDHEYKAYEDRIGKTYREYSTAIVDAFKAHGVRVVLGSPGCVGKLPGWVKNASGTVEDLNLNLCELRNIDVNIAADAQSGFADVFWPMLTAGFEARQKYGADYAIAGKDGVHPGWAGQLVMAYAFLKALGLDGEIGTFTVDLSRNSASASAGHEVVSCNNGDLQIRSRRYPFCAVGELNSDNSIRSGMSLISFNTDLNRLMLVVKNGTAKNYKVTWGGESRSYSAEQLRKGVNLAEDFPANPFKAQFDRVDAAVAAKQSYETRQIKDLFHGPEGGVDPDGTASLTEKARAPLAAAIREAFVPVTHTVQIQAE